MKSIYLVTWVSDNQGRECIFSEETEVENEWEAYEVAYEDYYFLRIESIEFIKDVEE